MNLPEHFRLRTAQDEDRAFFLRLYVNTRADEFAAARWDELSLQNFLRMQFDLRERAYLAQYPSACLSVIELAVPGGFVPVGRLSYDEGDDAIALIDIALLSPHQSKGIGSACLSQLMHLGRRAKLPVRLHVQRNNPAKILYERLGFTAQPDAQAGEYLAMQWHPVTAVTPHILETCNEKT